VTEDRVIRPLSTGHFTYHNHCVQFRSYSAH